MDKLLNENLPIYMQIMDKIRAAIVSGELAAGSKGCVGQRAGGGFWRKSQYHAACFGGAGERRAF